MAKRKTTLDERIELARIELDKRRGPGPFDCQFCGVKTEHPCVLACCLECQNFGYYEPPASTESPARGGRQG